MNGVSDSLAYQLRHLPRPSDRKGAAPVEEREPKDIEAARKEAMEMVEEMRRLDQALSIKRPLLPNGRPLPPYESAKRKQELVAMKNACQNRYLFLKNWLGERGEAVHPKNWNEKVGAARLLLPGDVNARIEAGFHLMQRYRNLEILATAVHNYLTDEEETPETFDALEKAYEEFVRDDGNVQTEEADSTSAA